MCRKGSSEFGWPFFLRGLFGWIVTGSERDLEGGSGFGQAFDLLRGRVPWLDCGHLLAVAAKDDGFPVFLDGFDEGGKAAFGFVHVGGDHGELG